ncbi:MAG: alpha-galactosidase [Bacteroidales bacterium]|nr:alpha-galactosidase [Bacteroidales bacterium]
MKRILPLIALLAIPFLTAHAARKPVVIAVETAHSALVLKPSADGQLMMCHYGARVADPQEFAAWNPQRRAGQGPWAYPAQGGMYMDEPALAVRYADSYRNTEPVYVSHTVRPQGNLVTTTVLLRDTLTALEVRLVYDAYQAEDVIVSHAEIINDDGQPVRLVRMASSSMYIDADRYLLTHCSGNWAAEMQVERELLTRGMKVIETRRGTQVTHWSNPSFMLSLDTDTFSETSGEVIAGSLAWSGNYRLSFEKDGAGRLRILAGISPFSSEYPLAAGETFTTPDMVWTWSGQGAGQASRNLHAWARHYGIYGGARLVPTLLNSWEGAYFTFTTKTLTDMIDDAASLGLEMFVLDDGWFGTRYPRNNDSQGLGDWEPNAAKLPEGIDYIASYAHQKGLKFGIWIEPEMVSPRSCLAEEHPEWVVRAPGRKIHEYRHQWVLDLANPVVQDFVFGIFDRTMQLSRNIDYIKWDCNRTVFNFGSDYLGDAQERFYIDYVQGLYNVMRRIREKYPDVLVQCCSSGGGRVDYGALRWFDEFWTSDDTDAAQRFKIQYGTSLFYPATVMGSHVSAVPNHQTGAVTPLKFRFDIACAGRLGMELQPKRLTAEERALADRCIQSYKGYRDIVSGGDLYRLASPYEGPYDALMYVAEDRSRAVVFLYCTDYTNRDIGGKPFRLQGLDPDRKYRVKELNVDKSCWNGDGGTYSGAYLAAGGFNPVLYRTYESAVFLLEVQ